MLCSHVDLSYEFLSYLVSLIYVSFFHVALGVYPVSIHRQR